MRRTQISLTDDDRRLLDAEAARTGLSIAALIRRAIAHTYGGERNVDSERAAIDAAFGAWKGREVDGAAYVESLRSGSRLLGGERR